MSSSQFDLTEEQVRRASEAVVDAVLFIRNGARKGDLSPSLQQEREQLIRSLMLDPTMTGWLLSDDNFQIH